MGRAKKRTRIGSDEYTIEMESRVKLLEETITNFGNILEEMKQKDVKIAELEAELKSRTCFQKLIRLSRVAQTVFRLNCLKCMLKRFLAQSKI